jgi:hypothetical protein
MLAQSRPHEASPDVALLADVLIHYLEHARQLRSVKEAARAVKYILTFFGGCTVADLSASDRMHSFAISELIIAR